VRVRRGGSHSTRDSSRLELGRLPSAEDGGGWDLPRKVAVQRQQEDNESTRTVEI